MKMKSILAALPVCAGLMLAQNTSADMNRSTQGKTFSGILVASGCNSSSVNSVPANQASVDQSGGLPRGTQPEGMKPKTPVERSVTSPQTGMAGRDRGADTSATTGGKKGEWESGGANAKGWDKECFISPATSSFVFVTKDGKQLNLDDASNSMVSQRLSSSNRVSEKSKVFRVRITGDMTGETVHITEIQM